MEGYSINDEIRTLAEKQIEEKRQAELESLSHQIEKERSSINKLLKMISEQLLFKHDEKDRYSKKYIIVTPEIFKEDYVREPENKYTAKGIVWNEEWNEGKNCYLNVVKVNGICYYDMRFLMYRYEKNIDDLVSRANHVLGEVAEVEDKLRQVKEEYPAVVKMMHDWAESRERDENRKYPSSSHTEYMY